MNTFEEDLQFYLDRLHYYDRMINAPGLETFLGFGVIEFYHKDIDSVKWTYDFWYGGMISFIQKYFKNRYSKEEKKSDEK